MRNFSANDELFDCRSSSHYDRCPYTTSSIRRSSSSTREAYGDDEIANISVLLPPTQFLRACGKRIRQASKRSRKLVLVDFINYPQMSMIFCRLNLIWEKFQQKNLHKLISFFFCWSPRLLCSWACYLTRNNLRRLFLLVQSRRFEGDFHFLEVNEIPVLIAHSISSRSRTCLVKFNLHRRLMNQQNIVQHERKQIEHVDWCSMSIKSIETCRIGNRM